MRRQTQQQRAIEAAFTAAGRPLAPHEILEAARNQSPSLNLATVYRAVKRMLEENALHLVELPGEPARYELRTAADRHHHHFRCRRCDSVFDLRGCVEGLKKLLPRGFRMTDHEIVLYGYCPACRA